MKQLVEQYLRNIHDDCVAVDGGAVADYIPELAAVDPDAFGLSLAVHDGHVYRIGDTDVRFTIQSVSKPFTYALALATLGVETVDTMIDVEPSGEAFNEISLDRRRGIPKNAMINAGAILATSLVCDPADPEGSFELLLDWYSAFAGRSLAVNERVYRSECDTGARNRAIAYMLQSFGALRIDPEVAVEMYFRQCSVEVTAADLAVMAATLANGGENPRTGRQVIDRDVTRRILSVMTTCGMYDGAGDWVSAVGLPAKSGVSGAILAVLPGQLGIGVYAPRLDASGNSVRGLQSCRRLSSDLGLHMFNVPPEGKVTVRTTYDARELLPSVEARPQVEAAIAQRVRERIRVYELQGELSFTGTEAVVRRVDAAIDRFDTVILDLGRVDTINDVSLSMLLEMSRTLGEEGRTGLVVDPDRLIREGAKSSPVPIPDELIAEVVFGSLAEAVAEVEERAIRAVVRS